MRLTTTENAAEPPPSTTRIALSFAAALIVFAAVVLLPAGRYDWGAGWFYIGLVVVYTVANYVSLRRYNPVLIARRMRAHDDVKTWDKILGWLLAPAFVGVYVVAGLDAVRYGWSTPPVWLWPLGLLLFASGAALLVWSMGVNPFFERGVRIQREHGHRVVDAGPYRFVRHPGYLGFCAWLLGTPPLLGSCWALLPAALTIAGIAVRTVWEDRALREELPGYQDYTRRVPFRLIPGLW